MTKNKYQPVEPQTDFSQQEKIILDWWYKSGSVEQYLAKNRKSSKKFSFIDGPITANNPMGVHHARGRTIKDVFQRYKNFQGFAQRFQNGFDCQGLWVEVEVEKSQGFNSKKDIINFGIDNFTNACKERVSKYAQMQTEQSKRLGMFMDWPNSYYTNSQNNNLHIWHFLKKLHQKGLIYQKETATTWCPRCETGLSQHEQANGYKMVTDTSVYIKFKATSRPDYYFLAWTTTPWTLVANVLLAINTAHQYVEVKEGSQTLVMAKQSADRLGFKVQQPIDPQKIIGLSYQSLIPVPAQKNIKHTIVNWQLVDPQEGSGIVHIAPGCGQEDYDLGLSLQSDIINPIDSSGHFKQGFDFLSGKYAGSVEPDVLSHLKQHQLLFKTENIQHRYPHCWRCGTKCLFRLEDNWFIDCQSLKPQLKQQADQAVWIPKYIKKRMHNWLDNMGDWMISRKRYYGLSLPFYLTDDNQLFVVGSLEELKQLAVEPHLVDQLPSLHRPWIDQIKIKHPQTGEIMDRITDVGDCWLDAGVTPFSTLNYLTDKKYWQSWFPADLVCEMIEQVRLWYYSMLVYGVVFEQQIPYKTVLNYYEVRDEKGERMSKTKGNGIPFDQAVENMTADAMRWLYCKSKSYSVLNFGYNLTDQVKRGFISTYWNCYKYFIYLANNTSKKLKTTPPQLIDRWLISKLHRTIAKVTICLDKFDTSLTTETIESFITDLSTWYIRRCRNRQDNLVYLQQAIEVTNLLIAPIMPYISEAIYQNLSGNNFSTPTSVHHQQWPQANPQLIDDKLEKDMELVRLVCQLGHAQRQLHQIKIKQPLAKMSVYTQIPQLSPQFLSLIAEETNVKKVDWQKQDQTDISVSLDLNITEELRQEGEFRDICRQIQLMRKDQGLLPSDKIKLYSPTWPNQFEQQILKKTNAISIVKSNQLKLEKV